MYCRALWSGLCPRGRLRYYAGGVARQVCVCAMWLVVGARCGPAREGGVSVGKDVSCAGLIAGKPAPTGISGEHKICAWQRFKCGSEPAREGGVSGDGDVGCAGLFAGKPAPTGISGKHKICAWQRSKCERACSRKRYVSHIDTGWAAAIASKPAPTKSLVQYFRLKRCGLRAVVM